MASEIKVVIEDRSGKAAGGSAAVSAPASIPKAMDKVSKSFDKGMKGLNAFLFSTSPLKRGIGAGLAEATAGANMGKILTSAINASKLLSVALFIAEVLATGLEPILRIIGIFVKLIGYTLLVFLLPLIKLFIGFMKPIFAFLAKALKQGASPEGQKIQEGALGGALFGAIIGSILPGVGTIVGGIVGAIVGLLAQAGMPIITQILSWIGEAAIFIFEGIGKFFVDIIMPALGALFDQLKKSPEIKGAIDFFLGLFEYVSNVASKVGTLMESTDIDSLVGLLAALVGIELPDGEAIKTIMGKFTSLFDSLKGAFGKLVPEDIKKFLKTFAEIFDVLVNATYRVTKESVQSAMDFFTFIVKKFIEVKDVLSGFFKSFGGALTGNPIVALQGLNELSTSLGRVLGSRETGGPIDRTGLYQLHAGEYVVPAGGSGTTVNVTINNPVLDSQARIRELSRELQTALRGRTSYGRQFA